MQLKDLQQHDRNPRKISDKKLDMLKKALKKFGDLGGIVFNKKTGKLISGHQRAKSLPQNTRVIIEHKYDTPTECMTVGEGYLISSGEKFKYREVFADEKWEMEAMLAANQHGGEWDQSILKINLRDFPDIDLGIAGFELEDIDLFSTKPVIKKEEPKEESDEQYIKNEVKTEEQIDTEMFRGDTVYEPIEEDLPSEVFDVPVESAFDNIEEDSSSNFKKIIVIIECKDNESKDELKKFLRDGVIERFGAKMY